jgi:hypothetical protein
VDGTLMVDRENFGMTHRITSAFSFLASDDFHLENIRANRALEPLGCLGDLGWYCIRFSLWAMHWQMPLRVRGSVLSGGDGPPTTADSQETRMFRQFAKQVRSGALQESWFKEASLTQQVSDACMASALAGGAWRSS